MGWPDRAAADAFQRPLRSCFQARLILGRYITSLYTECINGLHEVRIAGEGLEGVGRIGLQEGTQAILLGIEIGELLPRQSILHVAPDPLDRAQLWTVRR